MAQRLDVRWTIGDVNLYGFEALRLSIWGVWRIFWPETVPLYGVNTISKFSVRRRVGSLPPEVTWRSSTSDLPDFLKPHLSSGMAEGTAWKFSPHDPHQGRCGAHFVGLNTKGVLWSLNGRPATEYIQEHWERHRNAVYERVAIAPESIEPVVATLARRHSAAPDSDQHSHYHIETESS